MLKKVVLLTLLLIFVAGTFSAFADDTTASTQKNPLQGMYDWFSGWGKTCDKSTSACCITCGKTCCKPCTTDCAGKCCSTCCKK